MKRICLLVILTTITIVTAMSRHTRKPSITLESVGKHLAVLESERYEILTNVELREETHHLFSELVERGGHELGDECVKVLVSDNSDSNSIRKAQLVLAQLDLTDKQMQLLDTRSEKDRVIWAYLALREAEQDDLGVGFEGLRSEHLPDVIAVLKRHRDHIVSQFDDFEHILDLKVIDMDEYDDHTENEIIIRSAAYGANTGTCCARIFAQDSNDVIKVSGGNPFIVRILLLRPSSLEPVILAIPDLYRESASFSAVRYIGTISRRYRLMTLSHPSNRSEEDANSSGRLETIGVVYLPLRL